MPWTFFDCHFAYNAGIALLLGGILEDPPMTDRENLLEIVKSILEVLASGGNESASSCRSILDWLTPLLRRLGSPRQQISTESASFPPNPWSLPVRYTDLDLPAGANDHEWMWDQFCAADMQ